MFIAIKTHEDQSVSLLKLPLRITQNSEAIEWLYDNAHLGKIENIELYAINETISITEDAIHCIITDRNKQEQDEKTRQREETLKKLMDCFE